MRISPVFFIFHIRALLTEEMEKEHAHINGGGCNKLARCLLFYFPLREWPRFENCFRKVLVWCAFFSHIFQFSFSSTSHQRNEKKNTRTSTVAAVTSLPRVCFFIFLYESGLVLKIVLEKYLFGAPFFSVYFFFHFRAFRTEEMKKEHAHINGGGCDKLATCLLFHFSLRVWPRSENHFEKYSLGAPFFPFVSFFIFEHFSQKK